MSTKRATAKRNKSDPHKWHAAYRDKNGVGILSETLHDTEREAQRHAKWLLSPQGQAAADHENVA